MQLFMKTFLAVQVLLTTTTAQTIQKNSGNLRTSIHLNLDIDLGDSGNNLDNLGSPQQVVNQAPQPEYQTLPQAFQQQVPVQPNLRSIQTIPTLGTPQNIDNSSGPEWKLVSPIDFGTLNIDNSSGPAEQRILALMQELSGLYNVLRGGDDGPKDPGDDNRTATFPGKFPKTFVTRGGGDDTPKLPTNRSVVPPATAAPQKPEKPLKPAAVPVPVVPAKEEEKLPKIWTEIKWGIADKEVKGFKQQAIVTEDEIVSFNFEAVIFDIVNKTEEEIKGMTHEFYEFKNQDAFDKCDFSTDNAKEIKVKNNLAIIGKMKADDKRFFGSNMKSADGKSLCKTEKLKLALNVVSRGATLSVLWFKPESQTALDFFGLKREILKSDVISFNFGRSSSHDVYQFYNKEAFDKCDFSQAMLISNASENKEMNELLYHDYRVTETQKNAESERLYFGSKEKEPRAKQTNCERGQKIAIDVTA